MHKQDSLQEIHSVNESRYEVNSLSDDHYEQHLNTGGILKSLIYGGLDGSINTLIILLTGIAAEQPPHTVIAFSLAAIVGDGIGMGLGDYLSARAEIQFIKAEQAREMFEVEEMEDQEKKEIIDIYNEKGYSVQDSHRLADLIATNKQAFVNVMMLQELGLVVIDETAALKCGVATLVAFMVLGALPLLPYLISQALLASKAQKIAGVVSVGLLELFSLGMSKAAIIGLNKWKSGFQTLTLGSVVTTLGYLLGRLLA